MISNKIKSHLSILLRWLLSGTTLSLLFTVSLLADESQRRVFHFSFDNDVLVPGSRDQDYTGGLTASLISAGMKDSVLYFSDAMNLIDDVFAINQSEINQYGVEIGIYGFTPENTQSEVINFDDRPYASILYLSNTHERVDYRAGVAKQSTLTIGILGLDMFSDLQKGIHSLTSSQQLVGWNHQISNGGELSVRYQFSRQNEIKIKSEKIEAKYSTHLSLGYITEASVSISSRFGNLNSSWWSFNPEITNYGEQRSTASSRNESYGFVGTAVKLRLHNSFLQGQFRHSEFNYRYGQLNHVILEAWAGYSHSLGDGYQLSYLLRAHTSEVKKGVGNRNLFWGGISISKTW